MKYAGFWIAITVLGIGSVVMFGLYFQQHTELLIARRALREKTPEEFVEMGNPRVRELIEAIEALENKNEGIMPEMDPRVFALPVNEMVEEIRKAIDDLEIRLASQVPTTTKRVTGVIPILQRRIEEMRAEVRVLEIQLQSAVIQASNYENLAKRSADDVTAAVSSRGLVQRLLDAAQRDRDVDLQRMNTRLAQEAQLYGGENTILQADINSTRITNNEIVESSTRMYRDLMTEKHILHQALTAKVDATGTRDLISREPFDGEILNVDIASKIVVVDLGRINRVRRGMRFDVIRWENNTWQYIATIELMRVDHTTSTAAIMDRAPVRVFDPTTGYEPSAPEALYSPLSARGDEGNRVVPLMREEREYTSTMKELNPILRGDKISNPFYSRGKQLRFAVTGEPVRYDRNRIHTVLRENGVLVQSAPDETTDFVILGILPEKTQALTDDEIKKIEVYERELALAETYGIPILREVHLFDFIRLE